MTKKEMIEFIGKNNGDPALMLVLSLSSKEKVKAVYEAVFNLVKSIEALASDMEDKINSDDGIDYSSHKGYCAHGG